MNRLRIVALLGLVNFGYLCSPNLTPAAEDAAPSDSESILGYWQCTEATFKGKPFRKYVGTVYLFKGDGQLEMQDYDSWSRWRYRLDSGKRPKQLATSWAGGNYDSEIYELSKDQLRIRSADDPQPLSFDRNPKGKWNESIFKRISTEDAQEQIKKLKAAPDDD